MKTKADVIAENHRPQQRLAASVVQFARRQRRRHDRTTGMELAVRIVGLVRVAGHAVGKGRHDRRRLKMRAEHTALLFAALFTRMLQPSLPGFNVEPDTIAASESSRVALALLNHFRRQLRGSSS